MRKKVKKKEKNGRNREKKEKNSEKRGGRVKIKRRGRGG